MTLVGSAINVAVTCPNCGKQYDAAPGENVTLTTGRSGRLELVRELASLSASERANLFLLLQEAQRTGKVPEAAVLEQAPTAVQSWLRNPNQQGYATLLALLTVLLTLFPPNSEPPTPTQITNITIQMEQPDGLEKMIPRRGPCWCGSEKRYKNCHGRTAGNPVQTP